MSSKELNYIDDALGHEKFLKTQCQDAIKNLQDTELKNCVQQIYNKHQEIFDNFCFHSHSLLTTAAYFPFHPAFPVSCGLNALPFFCR